MLKHNLMDSITIEGSGGGGAPRRPIVEPDTLQSTQKVKLLFAVSEGPVKNIENVLLNEVGIDNYDATWDWRPGTATQTVIPGFINTEEPIASFTPVNISALIDYFVSVNYLAASCRITLTLNTLKQILPTTNDTVGYEVRYEIYTRPSTSSIWEILTTIVKKGKASSAYSWDTLIPAPAGVTIASSWEIKLVRITEDDDSNHFSTSTWSAATAIIESDLNYPNTALIAVTLLDADQFGGNIPEFKFVGEGLEVKIPTNYDPVLHTYDESIPWDLSLTENIFHFTANPAWHIYAILNSSRFGLNISKNDIDVISLYELSKVADELVPDGKGGTERRFELNNQFYAREKPNAFLVHLLTICNANITTNEFGQVSIMFDRPNQPVVKQVVNSNIIDGKFKYSSTEQESRYNSVNVTYNRQEFNGKTDTVTYSDQALINRYGLQSSDIVLAGCTSEAQALRKARWAIYTSSYTLNVINYELLFAGLTYHAGMLVRIFDALNQQAEVTGIIKNHSQTINTTTIELDREVTLTNDPYIIYFMGQGATTEKEYPINQTDGNFNSVTFSGLDVPVVNSPFILVGAVKSRLAKVIKVKKSDEKYQISVLEHKEEKYAYIDSGDTISTPTGDFVNILEFTTVPVTNILVVENFSSNGITQNTSLDISWDWDKGNLKYAANFIVSWKRDTQESNFITDIFANSYSIPNPTPGIYEITVWAVNPISKIKSAAVVQTYNFRSTSGTSSLLPPENVFVAGTTGVIFVTQDLHVNFTYPLSNGTVSDILLDYVIEVWNTTKTELKGEYVVKPNKTLGGTFFFSFTENRDRFITATRQFSLRIFSRDVIGDLSLPVEITVNNPVPTPPIFSLLSGTEATFIDITRSPDVDVIGYEIHRDLASNTPLIPSLATLVADGPDTYVTLKGEPGTSYIYRVGAYDTFGKAGITYATEQSTSLLNAAGVDVWVFEGLIFKPNDPSSDRVSWTDGTASKNGNALITINAGNSTSDWTSGIQYFYYDGTSNTISVTDDITIAVSGAMVLATYKGGTKLIVGNGDAFVDGGLLLANTVGANQLVTDSAIITNTAQLQNAIIQEAHLGNGVVTNLKIGNNIQSINYNPGTFDGWAIDKNAIITSFGALNLFDSNGNLILTTGTNAGIQWNKTQGVGRPADNADVTGSNTSLNTLNVDTLSAAQVSAVGNNFNNRNDRNTSAVQNPSITSSGAAIDHIVNTDGTVTISFEWNWFGVTADIDGFYVYHTVRDGAGSYSFNQSEAEFIGNVPGTARSYIFIGVPANKYHNFGVQAYRYVDNDIAANGSLKSSIVVPVLSSESPYLPESNVAYSGDITGTINGQAIGSLANQDNVGSSNLLTGPGTNLIDNGNFLNGQLDKWTKQDSIITTTFGVNLTGFHPTGLSAAYLQQSNADTLGFGQILSDKISAVAGKRYEFFAYTAAHRCTVLVLVLWYDGNDVPISNTPSGTNASETAGGTKLAGYKQTGDFGVAPANTEYARLIIRKNATNSGQADSWMFAAQVYFGEAYINQTEFSRWMTGPAIDGATIGTNLKGTFDTNNINVFMPGAAIGNLQIDRGTANKLTIQQADIVDLAVSTLKIQGNAINVPVGVVSNSSLDVPYGGLPTPLITYNLNVPPNTEVPLAETTVKIQFSCYAELRKKTSDPNYFPALNFILQINGVTITNYNIPSRGGPNIPEIEGVSTPGPHLVLLPYRYIPTTSGTHTITVLVDEQENSLTGIFPAKTYNRSLDITYIKR